MRVQDIMTKRVETVSAGDTVTAAAERMRQQRIRHLVVMRKDEVVGILSDRDLASTAPDLAEHVEDVMTSPAVASSPDMTLRRAANLLRGRSVGCLPVKDGDRLVGIVTTTDLLERIGRGGDGGAAKGKRWILKGRGPRRQSVKGRRQVASH
jgi:acetoin utilization protein AcuB